ncbi:MAG: integral rane sensor hybrid histidine kinase [Caulobacteraceae bacterium]|nr:integral rane sensor hybrid histidine kinase [Caulobacteraceae bacterium]
MFTILMCVTEEHDLRLVVVAAVICAAASVAAFGFQQESARARQGLRWSWLALAGLVAGSGVWATHFIAMLAYQPSLRIGYEVIGTAASLLFAIAGMGVAFSLTLLPGRRAEVLAGGAIAGLTIAGMHYIGIAAVRAQADLHLDFGYVLASLAIGALGGMAAFWTRQHLAGAKGLAASASLFMLTVCGLHFTAMAGIELLPDATRAIPEAAIGRGVLAIATSALAALILAAASALVWMGRFSRRDTLENVRSALDAVPAALAFFSAEDRLISWNAAFTQLMIDCGVEPVEGMLRRDMRAGAQTAGWADPIPEQPASDASLWSPEEFRLPDGRWLRREAFATQDGGGVSVLSDVTDQRASTQAIAAARDAAEAASRAKSAFLANMSHEIRTPLNGVLGIADILLATELSARQRELVGVMQSSGSLLNALLTDLLDLARVEAGMAALRPEPTDLAALVLSVRDLFAGRAEQKGLALLAEIDLGPVRWAACDPLRLRQVIGNLVNNAVKFTETGEVVITARRRGDQVEIQVRDTGVGFDEALKGTLFGRFQQADDTSTRRHGGAGLGLTICQEYVHLMGGELDCASRPGVGSTFGFTVKLPALAESARPAQPDPTLRGGLRVLVVDDNQTNRRVLGLILDSAGIVHGQAEDGAIALDAAMTRAFDAVLMDIQMPVMDGFEATRRIRAWEAATGRPRMPIYFVSASCMQEHVDAGVAAGGDGHLSKPVSVVQLLGVLEPHTTATDADLNLSLTTPVDGPFTIGRQDSAS